jgi:hypothetical protein
MGGILYALGHIHDFSLFLIFARKTPPPDSKKKAQTPKIPIMSRDVPLLPSPDGPSNRCVKANALDDAFDAMLLNPTTISNNKFIDNWGAADIEQALLLSSVDDTRLKDCIVATLASVWGITTICPGLLEA